MDIAITWRPDLSGEEVDETDNEYCEHRVVAEVKVGKQPKQLMTTTGSAYKQSGPVGPAEHAEAVHEAREKILALALRLFERTEG